jgi:hypothetical protein
MGRSAVRISRTACVVSELRHYGATFVRPSTRGPTDGRTASDDESIAHFLAQRRSPSSVTHPPAAQSRSVLHDSPGRERASRGVASDASHRPLLHDWSFAQLTLARQGVPSAGLGAHRCVTRSQKSLQCGFVASRARAPRYVARESTLAPQPLPTACAARQTPGLVAPCPAQCSASRHSSEDVQRPPSSTSPRTAATHSAGAAAAVGATQPQPRVDSSTRAAHRAAPELSMLTVPARTAADRIRTHCSRKTETAGSAQHSARRRLGSSCSAEQRARALASAAGERTALAAGLVLARSPLSGRLAQAPARRRLPPAPSSATVTLARPSRARNAE